MLISNEDLLQAIAERYEPEGIIELLGIDSDELVDLLRVYILEHTYKFEEMYDE